MSPRVAFCGRKNISSATSERANERRARCVSSASKGRLNALPMTLSGNVKGINTLSAQPSIVSLLFLVLSGVRATAPPMQRTENKRRNPFNRPPMFIHFPRSSAEFCTRFTIQPLHQSRGGNCVDCATLLAIHADLFSSVAVCELFFFFFSLFFNFKFVCVFWGRGLCALR